MNGKGMITLNSEGKLVVRYDDGKEIILPLNSTVPVQSIPLAVVFVLIDVSGSMWGEKLIEVKQGALNFARTAIEKGYSIGLIEFSDKTHLICEPTRRISTIASAIETLCSDGGTMLGEALRMVSERFLGKIGSRIIVLATDGSPFDIDISLRIAAKLKKDKVEILCVATSDANDDFISRIVSRKDLNVRVAGNEFASGMETMARKLPVQYLEDKR